MDREYALDMTNYRFSPLESVPWARMDSGLHLRTGSIVRAEWAFVTDIKHTVPLAPNHTLRVDVRLQQDATAQRSLVDFNYNWRVAGQHHVGAPHTISQYKPDFDASVYYQYGTAQTGRARAELTALDAYHDLIFRTLGVSEKDEEFVRTYRQHPFLGQITLQTPARHPLRAELHVGWQPTSELLVQSQLEPDHRYRDREAAHYVGALVEYSTDPVTGGLIVHRDKSTPRPAARRHERLPRRPALSAGRGVPPRLLGPVSGRGVVLPGGLLRPQPGRGLFPLGHRPRHELHRVPEKLPATARLRPLARRLVRQPRVPGPVPPHGPPALDHGQRVDEPLVQPCPQ
jgi:hypothetical protein